MNKIIEKGKRKIRLYLKEFVAYNTNFFKSSSSNQIRLIIFGQGRTGSTLLEDLLCSTGHFYQNGELLDTTNHEVLYPLQYVCGLAKWRSRRNFIFHLKIYQLTRNRVHPVDPLTFLNTLYKDGWKFVYLRRNNKVNHALSNLVANHRGNFHKFTDDKEVINVDINIDNFVRRVNKRFEFDESERKMLKHIQFHEVVYEDDLENSDSHQETINKILDYVGLEHRIIATKYKKVNAQPLEKVILNYEEFSNCIKRQGWQEFL